MTYTPDPPPPDPIPENLDELPPLPELRTGPPPAPMPQAVATRYKGVYWPPERILRAHLLGHAIAFYFLAASMALQAERYTTETLPSLVYLLARVPLPVWSLLFFTVATIKMVAFWRYPQLSRVATTSGMGLVTMLLALFFLAWAWGPATAFLVTFAALDIGGHVFAICHIDGRRRWREPSN